jgi:hypothetical protein
MQDKKGKFAPSAVQMIFISPGRAGPSGLKSHIDRAPDFDSAKSILEGCSSYKGAWNPIDTRFFSPSDDVQGRGVPNFFVRQADGG